MTRRCSRPTTWSRGSSAPCPDLEGKRPRRFHDSRPQPARRRFARRAAEYRGSRDHDGRKRLPPPARFVRTSDDRLPAFVRRKRRTRSQQCRMALRPALTTRNEIQCVTRPNSGDSGRPGRRIDPIFSSERVPIVTDFFGKMPIVGLRNDGEWGISHASLYSLRDHSFDCDRPWRLCWTPRESRGCRALEGRLAKTTG